MLENYILPEGKVHIAFSGGRTTAAGFCRRVIYWTSQRATTGTVLVELRKMESASGDLTEPLLSAK